jgi:hypothetical protein
MNELNMLAYLEPEGESQEIPFERYYPAYSPGMVKSWLQRHIPGGSWVMEPIGASPASILEMADAGYKVLAVVNNPVAAFELEMLSRAPSKALFQSVLRELSIQKKGTERLEAHIQNLYLTRCSSCGKEVAADYFIWRKSENAPFAKSYHCPACRDEGEHPVTEDDLERLAPYKRSDPLHRARALERVPGGTREARQNLEEVLNIYASRALYALFTLINKLEGMPLTPQRRTLMDALLLSALDAGHSLWPNEDGSERPRALNIPAEYIEKNLWLALESALEVWSIRDKPINLTHWPEVPESGGICLYQGRMRDLWQQKSSLPLQSVVCTLPRPSQVFWTLSTLWSSWLWGKENAANLKNVLERQRFDWYWHTNALQSALSPAGRMVKPGSEIFCLLPEPVPGFVSAAVEACCASSLQLSGIGWKDELHPVQTEWLTHQSGRETKKVNLHKIIREAIHKCLSENGEPCRYLKLYTAVNVALAQNLAFPAAVQQLTYETTNEIHGEIAKIFADRKFLRRLDATAQDLESGYWWLAQPEGCQVSLADRVETEIVNWLQKEPQISVNRLQETLNARFPGFLTPAVDLVEQCVRSYADLDQSTQTWHLKKNEAAAQRKKDLAELHSLLFELAEKIGFAAEGDNPVLWIKPDQPDQPVYRLHLSASTLVCRFLGEDELSATESVFLFPGSRSALLKYKLDRDPYLRERIPHNWHFLKYRTLRELAKRKDISKDLWDLFIDSDPISLEDATQLSMFL